MRTQIVIDQVHGVLCLIGYLIDVAQDFNQMIDGND